MGPAVLNRSDNLTELLRQAETLLELCRQLDYRQIIAHDPGAVAALKSAVRTIRGAPAAASAKALSSAAATPAPISIDEKEALQERRRRYVELLGQAGLADRLGKVYATGVATRLIPLRDTPHRRGLPSFDMVIAPDYSPEAGFHGIFVAGREVYAMLLPLPAAGQIWQLRERHAFDQLERMVDLVSILSAGFPVH